MLHRIRETITIIGLSVLLIVLMPVLMLALAYAAIRDEIRYGLGHDNTVHPWLFDGSE